MGSQRQSWAHPIGKAISLTSLVLALPCGVHAVLSGIGLFEWSLEPGRPISHWWGTSALALLCVALTLLALAPTWSITAGPRGTGLKRLWRHTFIPHETLREVRLGSGDPPNLRFVTEKGTVRVFPRMGQSASIAEHVRRLQGR
jgi:hypothetical protein